MDSRSGIIALHTGSLDGGVTVTVDLDIGGRIAQIDVAGRPLLWDDRTGGALAWGSFPMAPWAGRIRNGRFRHDGVDHRLELNHEDADGSRHAIHGTVYTQPWTLDDLSRDDMSRDRTTADCEDARDGVGDGVRDGVRDGVGDGACTGTRIDLHCDLRASLGWPFAGFARQRIIVGETAVRCELAVESTGDTFPAAIGWHPWFRKPDRLSFEPTAMYARADIGLPRDELVEPAPGPWDDTFRNTAPVTLHYDGPKRSVATSVTVTSDCEDWVLFDEPAYATCVEPQSGPPDALTVRPLLVRPDAPLERWMEIAWG